MSIRPTSRFVPLAAALAMALASPADLPGQVEEPVEPTAADSAPAAPPDTTPAGASSGAHGWEEAWTLELSRGVGAPAVWVDSLLLVASLDRNVHLVAVSEERGRVVWDDNFGGGFEASPLVTRDRIYLPETRRGEELVALDRRTREVLWKSKAGDLVGRPVARGEVVYTVDTDGEAAAFGPNGTRRWFTELETRVVAAPILLGDALVVADTDGTLYALDPATGSIRERATPEAGMIWGDPVPMPGATDAALFATLDGQVLVVRGDLSIADRRSFPSRFYAAPVVDDGRIYLIGHEGTAWAYDWEAAEVVWRKELEGVFRAEPAIGERFVAFGNLGGTLWLLDRSTGETLWHTRLDGAITASPSPVGDAFYATTEQGTLYYFRPTG